jgi:hypothetical protein
MKKGDFRRDYRRGASLRRLSVASGRSRSYVLRRVQLANVRLRDPKRFPSDPDWWRGQIERGLTPKALAVKLGCSEMTVYRHLRSTIQLKNARTMTQCVRRVLGARPVLSIDFSTSVTSCSPRVCGNRSPIAGDHQRCH